MIDRLKYKKIISLLSYFPVVGITGPRQCGKTTLAKQIAKKSTEKEFIYLDLESETDLAKLQNPSVYLEYVKDKCVILDEIQRKPELFPVLRSLIDRYRFPARFIILGSASPDLIRNSSESLAGRIAYVELTPLLISEVSEKVDDDKHWIRGGYPLSLLAPDNNMSFEWLKNFVQTYAERDFPMLGLPAEPAVIKRLWRMIAAYHGNILNVSALASAMGVANKTINKYLDFFEQAYLIRRLSPYFSNVKKRVVKSPKIYIRDTGVLHYLNGIKEYEDLFSNVLSGASWEGYVLEQIISQINNNFEIYYYRTHHGTECDLVLVKNNLPIIAIEVKLSNSPKLSKSFRIAIDDLKTQKNFIISKIDNDFPITENVWAVTLKSFLEKLSKF